MSSEEGLTSAKAPPRIGDYRFYPAASVRRHHQISLQRQQMIQRRLMFERLHQQRQQLVSQQIQLHKMATEAEATVEKGCDADVSSVAAALYMPRTVAPVSPLKVTNLDRLMESVTPFIQARYLSEVNAGNSGMQEANSHPFFYMEDLWESFHEWSVYGAAVPLLVNGRDPIEQYYAPSLSGIQLYIDQLKHSSWHGGLNQESSSESYWLTNVMSSRDAKGNKIAKSVLNLNMQQLNRLSLGDQSVISSSSSAAASANSLGSPMFQFLEHEQPYNRRPLSEKMSLLASEYPELRYCRSCDLLPISWICVAWYPIYRIPTGPTLQDLEASFLTFHSLSTQSKGDCPTQLQGRNEKMISGGAVDSAPKISLPVFALASYKLRGSIVSPCGPLECEQENSLLQAADNWLRCLEVILPDYQFFRAHYTQRR